MKVKLLKAKVVNGSVEPAHQIVDVPERVAKKWIEAKEAETLTPLPTPPHLEERQMERGEKKAKPAEAKE